LEAQGLGGARLRLFQDSLRIEGKGWRVFLFQGTTGDVDIQLSNINGIQLKKVGYLYRSIRFSFVNSLENKDVMVHFLDETSIRFKPKQQSAFEEIKDAIENRKNTSILDKSEPMTMIGKSKI
jgi:hypothetical protein